MSITKLSAEQEAKIPAYVEKWIGIGLSTDQTVDKQKIEKGIELAYKTADLTPPKSYVYLDNPLQGVLLHSALRNISYSEFLTLSEKEVLDLASKENLSGDSRIG